MTQPEPFIVLHALFFFFQFLQGLVLIFLVHDFIKLLAVEVPEDVLLFGLVGWELTTATMDWWKGVLELLVVQVEGIHGGVLLAALGIVHC